MPILVGLLKTCNIIYSPLYGELVTNYVKLEYDIAIVAARVIVQTKQQELSFISIMEDSCKKRVIVIGGGFAGLSAAAELSSHAEVQVILVEAADYLGMGPYIL